MTANTLTLLQTPYRPSCPYFLLIAINKKTDSFFFLNTKLCYLFLVIDFDVRMDSIPVIKNGSWQPIKANTYPGTLLLPGLNGNPMFCVHTLNTYLLILQYLFHQTFLLIYTLFFLYHYLSHYIFLASLIHFLFG